MILLINCFRFKALLFLLIVSATAGVAQNRGPVNHSNTGQQLLPSPASWMIDNRRLGTPYFDALVGLGLIDDFGSSLVAPSIEVRGGFYLIESMFFGTGLQVLSVDEYEAAIVLPFEVGVGSTNNRWQFSSSLGYAFLPWAYQETAEGKTLAADVYWRPSISLKQLKFVLAFGGTMYDFGDYYATSRFCRSCDRKVGPQFTLRLRAGIGL